MTPQECWQEFLGNMTPAEFMAFFDDGEPADCVRNSPFVKKIPDFLGIIRRGTWKETFSPGREQINRLTLEELLIEYLEQTREEWESLVSEVRKLRKEKMAGSPGDPPASTLPENEKSLPQADLR